MTITPAEAAEWRESISWTSDTRREGAMADFIGRLLAALDERDRQLVEVRRAITELRDAADRLISSPEWRTYWARGRLAAFNEALALLPEVES